jgi:hypothetical protein
MIQIRLNDLLIKKDSKYSFSQKKFNNKIKKL